MTYKYFRELTCSYLEYIKRRCWYVSGRISRMNGGEFFKFNFGLWHNFTTLSINFHVFSIVRRLISNLGGVTLAENAPWRRENRYEIFRDPAIALLARGLSECYMSALNPANDSQLLWRSSLLSRTSNFDGVFLDLRPSALLPIRPTSTWFYSCHMNFWPQRPAP